MKGTTGTMLFLFQKESMQWLTNIRYRMYWNRVYQNQLSLEAVLIELTLHAEQQGFTEVGDNVRSALWAIGEYAGHIKAMKQTSLDGHTPIVLEYFGR